MKNKFYIMALSLIAPLVAGVFTSCSDDDDLPDVSFEVKFDNGYAADGSIYVVQGDSLDVTSIQVFNNEANKTAIIPYATYYFDYVNVGATMVAPFAMDNLTTVYTPVGNHVLEIACPVLAVGKSVANAMFRYQVVVVESADDMPENAVPVDQPKITMKSDVK